MATILFQLDQITGWRNTAVLAGVAKFGVCGSLEKEMKIRGSRYGVEVGQEFSFVLTNYQLGMLYQIKEMCNFSVGFLPSRVGMAQKMTEVYRVEEYPNGVSFRLELDRGLVRNYEVVKNRSAEFLQACENKDERFLVGYFLRVWQQSSLGKETVLARQHVIVYLQFALYEAVKGRWYKFRNFDFPQKTWEEYLSIATAFLGDVNYLVSILEESKDEYKLEMQFKLKFTEKIRDVYEQKTGDGKYSRWYKFKKASDKQLKELLKQRGWDEMNIFRHLAARRCLFEVYSKSEGGWQDPKPEQYKAAADFYNRHYQGSTGYEVVDMQLFKCWIKEGVSALKLSLDFVSVDHDDAEVIGKVTKSKGADVFATESCFDVLERKENIEEFKSNMRELNIILCNEVKSLKETDQKMLKLIAKGMKLTEVGAVIGEPQYKVTRYRQRCERQLLKGVSVWLKNERKICLSSEKTAEVQDYIEWWIKNSPSLANDEVLKEI